MYQPLISIIITVLNGGSTLDDCLTSIIQQSFTDYELILVDGGSKDNTLEIINASKIKNKTVKIIPGAGLYTGLNAGVDTSIGKWLYFMGADDVLHSSDTLCKVAQKIETEKSDAKVIVGDVKCVKQKYVLRPMLGSPYLMRHQVHHQGMFYDRTVFDTLSYDESMKISSDYELNLKLSLLGIPHQKIDIIVCNFGGDGISENQLQQGFIEMQKIHKRLFTGIGRSWVVNYFWLRRKTGAIIRRNNLLTLRTGLKKLFG